MRLKNKKTGEIIEKYPDRFVINSGELVRQYDSLAELNEEWEDYEEPKEYWAIDCFIPDGDLVSQFSNCSESVIENRKSIGNYFETREEAEKAVEKLKALASLRKRGLKFNGWDSADRGLVGEFEIYCDAVNLDGIEQELELVFGREEA